MDAVCMNTKPVFEVSVGDYNDAGEIRLACCATFNEAVALIDKVRGLNRFPLEFFINGGLYTPGVS